MPAPTIDQLTLADDPARWSALGFALTDEQECRIGDVRLRFTEPAGPTARGGIVGWSLRDALSDQLDGLPTTIAREPDAASAPAAGGAHPNGVVALDHIVAISPDLDRSVGALRAAGLDLRRVREQPTPAGAPRQAFFRLGQEVLELVQEPDAVIEREGGTRRPAHFWGLALLVEDLERTVALLAPHAGQARAAVQPGRRIATLRRSAGLAVPLALMSREARPGPDAGDGQDRQGEREEDR